MKQPFIFLFLLLSLPVFSQQVWSPDSSATAKNKAYAGLGLDWQKGQDKGNVFSIAAEYGRILNKNASLGVSGRVTWEATTNSGTAFNIHPFLRLHTSFPLPFPNLFVDIGYDFRRRRAVAVECINLIISRFHHFERANKPDQLSVID
ncbi:MAG: hypothetical protein IKP04_05000 [Candidatus Methanomethylophilaceae archaeon]|nr:hypothetical protein [Candidatus Methanomethylophilaceae archaeon]